MLVRFRFRLDVPRNILLNRLTRASKRRVGEVVTVRLNRPELSVLYRHFAQTQAH
jgi:hypothetical protein